MAVIAEVVVPEADVEAQPIPSWEKPVAQSPEVHQSDDQHAPCFKEILAACAITTVTRHLPQ